MMGQQYGMLFQHERAGGCGANTRAPPLLPVAA